MEKFEIYNDIAERTGGDIYVGVVGPVRTGKSTFIRNFMEKLVLENIENKNDRERAIDELPQSGAGKTIMTTQPKFVPNEAVAVKIGDCNTARVRLIDCVGYMVDGANGFMEEDLPRLIKTPWSDEEIPFEQAAEIGTSKVINEHSTIAVLVTTDGTVSGIDRNAYEKAEERVARELKIAGKPFVVLLNSTTPKAKQVEELAQNLENKYETKVIACNAFEMTREDIDNIIESILKEFYVSKIEIELPAWVRALPVNSSLVQNIMRNVKELMCDISKMKDLYNICENIQTYSEFADSCVANIDYGTGDVILSLDVSKELFYQMLSEECGVEIKDDFYLMSYMKHLTHAKAEYDKLKTALDQVKETGYGVVVPTLDEMTLEEPQITKKGGGSQVKLKATAPSLHIMRVDVETEVCPAVGSAEQSENLAKFMLSEFESNPQGIWDTNMFGKPLSSFVCEGINSKIHNIPAEAQVKMRKTMTKIVNEGKGGIICILL